MSIFRWILGGLIGASAGVLVWVLVGYFAHREVGWIAWGVGFLTGFGVRYAAYLCDDDASVAKGVFAAVVAIVAIVCAKYFVFTLLVADSKNEAQQLQKMLPGADDTAITNIARDLATQAAKRGENIVWPPGVTATTASKEGDFPPTIWSDAVLHWLGTGTPQEKEQKKQRFAASLKLSVIEPEFSDSFSPFDLLWFGLAIVTAFKVGVGSYGGD